MAVAPARTLPRYTTMLDVPETADDNTVVEPVKPLHEITDVRTRTYDEPLPSIAWWWRLLR